MASRRVSVTIDADLNGFNRGVLGASANTSKWVSELEKADGRTAMLVQTGLALAPAFAPIGAAVVPAIAGLTTQLGFAAVAGGTALLAFNGVGDALTKLNEYQLAPTSKNLEELNEKLDALGPAGEVFVRQLQEMRDEWQGLQDVAQAEMFPGVTEGIESAMTVMPAFERVIASVATALGDLAADAGAGIAGPEWGEFFDYLDREAGPILEQTGKAVGNMIEGVTNMVMAFDPLSDSFVTGMLEMSEAFVGWSDGLDSSEGFQEFVRYVQESGPQAMDTLGAIAGALIEFVEAAAPVGAVVLPVLEVLADALAGIADSPAGPVIVGAAAAIGTLGRSLALLSAVGLRGSGDSMIGKVLGTEQMKSYPAAVKGVTAANQTLISAQAALATQATKTRDAQFAMIPTADKRKAVQDFAKEQNKVREATAAIAGAEKERAAAMRASAAQIGKATAAAGGLALVASGAADGIGLSNTASLALMGTLAGPWGAAVGGAIGLTLDLREANDGLESAIRGVDAAIAEGDLSRLIEQSARLDEEWASQAATAAGISSTVPILGSAYDMLIGKTDEAAVKSAEARAEMQALSDGFAVVGEAMGATFTDSLGRNMVPTLEQLEQVAQRAAPAMRALGISAADLADADPAELQEMAGAIADWTTHADSTEGRTQAVADAFRDLDNSMVETTTSAERLKGSLDALLGPGMNLAAATDAWKDGLRNLNEELQQNNGSLFANTDAASQNRAAIRDLVSRSQDLLVAQANAGASSQELAGNMRRQRQAILDAGAAAGISRGQMNEYLRTLGLTPKLIKTLIQADTSQALKNVAAIRAAMDAVDRDRVITITTVNRVVNSVTDALPNRGTDALGGMYRNNTRFFDQGDIRNAHQPQIAPGGTWRVWAEDETQGESYIPHANDSRRPRARKILEDTAEILGARSVEWYAAGGYGGADEDPKKRKPRKKGYDQDDGAETAAERERREAREARQEAREIEAHEALMAQIEAEEERQKELAQMQADFLDGQAKAASDLLDVANSQLSAAESLRDTVSQSMERIGQAATAGFNSSLFGNSNAWSSGAGWRASLLGDISGLQEREGLIAQLQGQGLSAAALEALMGEASNQDIAGLISSGGLAEFDALIAQRALLQGGVASQAGNLAYGGEYAAANAQVMALSGQVAALVARLDQITAAQNPMSASTAAGYQQEMTALQAAITRGIVDGGNTVARRGTGAY